MIVCLCTGISDRDIRTAVAGGARHSTDVFSQKDCSPCCGSCCDSIDDMIAETAAQDAA